MGFNFDQDTDWIFMFCKKCWAYQKFIFKHPIDFANEHQDQYGQCVNCQMKEKISIKQAREYYDHLNDHNQ